MTCWRSAHVRKLVPGAVLSFLLLLVGGCTSDADDVGGPESPGENEPYTADDEPPVSGTMESIRWKVDVFRAQQQEIADGPLPLEFSQADCPEDADCADGIVIGSTFYAIYGSIEGAVESTRLISETNRGDVRDIVGIDPAAYLVLEQAGGPVLLEGSGVPYEADNRADAFEFTEIRCLAHERFPELLGDATQCRNQMISWYIGAEEIPWEIDDPYQLSSHRIQRTEPTEDYLDFVDALMGEGASPSDLAQMREENYSSGPYSSKEEILGLFADLCSARQESCRSGYRIDSQTATVLEIVLVSQYVYPSEVPRIESVFWSARYELLGSEGSWWPTQSGPQGVHQSGSGDEGLANANEIFDDCCDVTEGELTLP